jgi:lysophospholipase L1-like esterase
VRQIVRVSIGGDTLRIKFSNGFCSSATTINSVTIALSTEGKDAIDVSTLKELKFSGNSKVTIAANATVSSDPIAFHLTPSMRLAITTYFGQTPSPLSGHPASRTPSYILTGDKTTAANFSGAINSDEHWYSIYSIDVIAPQTSAAVVAFGNSITDGRPLTGGLQNRWTDAFSVKLLANPATAQVGVLNEGIGGTCVLSTCNNVQPGVSRFAQDVLAQAGLRWVIIFYGINDMGGSSASQITNGYKTMITAAHAKNIKVYGATVTPCGKNSDYASRDGVRTEVNKWIRAAGNFDAVIDFDKVIQDPSNPKDLLDKYSSDGLHPNADGYKLLGESIDLKLFESPVPAVREFAGHRDSPSRMILANHFNGTTMMTFEIPQESFVSLKVYSILGKEIAELAGRKFSSGKHTVEFESKNFTNGTYFYSIKADKFSAKGKMVLPVH